MKRILLLLLASACAASAQQTWAYVASSGNQSISAAYVVTLQQPATNSVDVLFPPVPGVGAAIYCSAACVFSVILNGSAATVTAGTVNGTTNSTPPAVVKLFNGSDSTGGTTLAAYNLAAGETFPLDLSAMKLPRGNTLSNISIAIASVTATVNITFFPLERH